MGQSWKIIRERLEEAENASPKALEINHLGYIYTELGCVIAAKKDFPEAIKFLRGVISFDAYSFSAWEELGIVFMMENYLRSSIDASRHSPSLSPKNINSRQDAAFFAPYLSHTYFQILRRRLILKTIEENKDNFLRNKWRVKDLCDALKQQIDKQNIFPKDTSQQAIETKAYNWVLHELLSIDSKIGLEGLGLLGFSLLKPDNWQAPQRLKELPWNLSESEVWTLYGVLFDSFRKNGAVIFPNSSDPKGDFFKPKNREYYFRENISDNKKHIFSWNLRISIKMFG